MCILCKVESETTLCHNLFCCMPRARQNASQSRTRRWTFTFFDTESKWAADPEFPDDVRYVIAGFEQCPDTGRDHWQGYAEFNVSVRLAGVQRLLGIGKSHAEPADRSAEANKTYCTKSGGRTIEFGEPSGKQGARTDLAQLRDDIRSAVSAGGAGAALRVAFDNHPGAFFMYPSGIRSAIALCQQGTVRTTAPNVEIHQGTTGTGKTRQAFERFPDLWRSPPATRGGTHWFDGYVGQKAVLIDDYDGKAFALSLILQILDRYPLSLPVKGGFTNWNPETIIITTNVLYQQWYEGENIEQRKALQRRITKVIDYTNDAVTELTPENWHIPFD